MMSVGAANFPISLIRVGLRRVNQRHVRLWVEEKNYTRKKPPSKPTQAPRESFVAILVWDLVHFFTTRAIVFGGLHESDKRNQTIGNS